MKRLGLQQRVLLVVLVAALPAFFVHFALQAQLEIQTANDHTATDTRNVAASLMPLLRQSLVAGDLATVQETLDEVGHSGGFRTLRLLSAKDRTVLFDAAGTAPSPAATALPAWFDQWLDIRFPVQQHPVQAGGVDYGLLIIEPSAAFLTSVLWNRFWIAVAIWLVTLALFLVLLRIVLRRSLRPLDDLAAAARELEQGRLDARAPLGDTPELADTAQAFNLMAGSLADAHRSLEQRVHEATRELESLIERVPVGVFKLRMPASGGMRFDYVSPRWCQQLNVVADAVLADPAIAFARIHADDIADFLTLHEQARASLAPFKWEGRLRPGLPIRWLHIESTPTPLENGDILWEGIQYDVSQTKEREAELDHIAHYDPLTGIPNRMLLADRLHQAIAHAQRGSTTLAVCYLDLDGFKPVNDTLGHKAGDTLLVEIARRLHSAVRGGDTVARIGGDEFILLLLDIGELEEYQVALSRVLDLVSTPFAVAGHTVKVSASIGIALYPNNGTDPDSLLRQADQAMYLAKQSGRNTFCFATPAMPKAGAAPARRSAT